MLEVAVPPSFIQKIRKIQILLRTQHADPATHKVAKEVTPLLMENFNADTKLL